MKNCAAFLFIIIVSSILTLSSCGGSQSHENNNKSSSSTIQNDTLYHFLLGGIYFFHGYGGADEVFNSVVGGQVRTKPGDDEYLKELESAYRNYFIFPFKTDQSTGCSSTLSSSWGIENKASFLKSQSELLLNGHQNDFMNCKKALDENGGANADISKIDLSKFKISEEEKTRLEFVKAHYSEFKKSGIKAWDIARYINNCAMAYCAGFISTTETIELMKKASPIAKERYENWKDYNTDFTLGRQFWGGEPETDKAFTELADKMLLGEKSIYTYVPFK
jgi:hypothetical protein